MASGNKSTQIATVTPKTAAIHPYQTTTQQDKTTYNGRAPRSHRSRWVLRGAHVAQQRIENSVSYVSMLRELV